MSNDILLYIFTFLDEKSLTRVSQLSNFFNSISSNHTLWGELFRTKWGPMFPLVPVCTINCCHKYFSDPYANLEPINRLFSVAFYKSLMIPAQIVAVIVASYSFKQMFKFRRLLYSYYAPLLQEGLKLLRSTCGAPSPAWKRVADPLGRPTVGSTPNSVQAIVDKAIMPNQVVAMLKNHELTSVTTTTYCVRITRLVPTRILRKMLALIIDYEKIPLWDVALRHCTGMVIKSPEINQQGQLVDERPIKRVDLLHKQIIGNLYMTYARMIYSDSVNDQFFANNSSIYNDIYNEDENDQDSDGSRNKRLRRVETNQNTEPLLKDPIYIVQHNIPFHVKGMNNHLIDKEVNPYQLDCFGSGFIFEPTENGNGSEVKMTYLLQLIKSDWMEDEAEYLLDDLALSRNRSISALISHAYHLSRS
eukprot:gene11529-13454_t